MNSPRQAIRKILDMTGMEHITSARELFEHIAYNCADHDSFRKLLDTCEPKQRVQAYNALTPHLRFEAKPLDVYIAQNADEAERKQLPTIGKDGLLLPFQTTRVESDEYRIQETIRKSLALIRMTVTCRKCTRQAEFFGDRKIDAIASARAAGWAHDETKAEGGETCPECLDFVN